MIDMRKTALRTMVLTSASLIMAATVAPAFGQTATTTEAGLNAVKKDGAPPVDATEAEAAGTEIIVTGTRIVAPNAVSLSPIASVKGDYFIQQTGSVSIGDKLNQLPQLRSTYSQQNSTAGLGTTGLNVLDLYGLGPQRTLVLVNGRRHVAASILNLNGQGVDINTIPNSLLERVDIVTGGSSSVYGSDAVAGVVNFVMKQNFEGVTANMRGGVSKYGDAGSYLATLTAGKNFAEGRGNIAGSIDFAHQTDFYGSDRPSIRTNSGFVQVESDPAGSPNGAAGGPDRFFFNDIRSTTISYGGLFRAASPTGACGRDATGAPFMCTFLFQPDGSLVAQTGTRVGLAPNGNFIGGNGNNSREGQIIALQPRQDRINVNLIGHYEITPAIVPYFEAKYVKIHTFGSQSGPAFIQGTTLSSFGFNSTYERPRLDNPYLSDQARTLITQQLIASGTAANTITGATRFSILKNLSDLGFRNENSHRDTYRIVGGVRGDLGSGFHYDVSANYGETRENTTIQGNLNIQRFLLAMDTVRNASGQIVCRSQVDPTTATLAQLPGSSAAVLAADIAACQPLNPFGQGSISSAARNYVTQDTVAITRIRQTDIQGSIGGDSSRWFALPGGPVGFSIGGEYRKETNLYRQDPLVNQGYTFYNAISTLSAPAFEVKEAFAEARVPLLKDLPFIKEFTLLGSGRYSDYKGATGKVWTYNGGGDWAPVQDIKFRGTYSHSVRAPNIRELYATQSANFANGFLDPCSARNIGSGSTTRAANCAAAGRPAGYDFAYTAGLALRSGGNPNLKPETSNSYTIGTILTPRWTPGLVVTIDYYDITVKNVISSVAAQTIVNSCYDSPTLANPFCAQFQRYGASGGPNGEIPFRIVENSLLSSPVNFASQKARGINLDATYRRSFGFGIFTAHGYYTHTIQRDSFLNPSDPTRATRIRGTLNDPIDRFSLDLDVQRGKVSFGYTLRFIGHQVLNAWEDTHSVQGRPPQDDDYADIQYYPNVFYHSLRASVDIGEHMSMYAGIDNLTNRMPPFGLTGVGTGSGIYDVRGRYYYTGARIKF